MIIYSSEDNFYNKDVSESIALYIMRMGDGNTYKIGFSKYPSRRRLQLQNQFQKNVNIVYEYQIEKSKIFFHNINDRRAVYTRFEKYIHSKFKNNWIEKELFSFSDDELPRAIEIIKTNKFIPFYTQFGHVHVVDEPVFILNDDKKHHKTYNMAKTKIKVWAVFTGKAADCIYEKQLELRKAGTATQKNLGVVAGILMNELIEFKEKSFSPKQ